MCLGSGRPLLWRTEYQPVADCCPFGLIMQSPGIDFMFFIAARYSEIIVVVIVIVIVIGRRADRSVRDSG